MGWKDGGRINNPFWFRQTGQENGRYIGKEILSRKVTQHWHINEPTSGEFSSLWKDFNGNTKNMRCVTSYYLLRSMYTDVFVPPKVHLLYPTFIHISIISRNLQVSLISKAHQHYVSITFLSHLLLRPFYLCLELNVSDFTTSVLRREIWEFIRDSSPRYLLNIRTFVKRCLQ